MSDCTHTLAERWDDCSDGGCPICAAVRIRELETEVRRLQNNEVNDCDLLGMHERRIGELEVELAEYTELKKYAKSLGQQTYLEIHAENERLKIGIAFGNDLLPALQQRIRELEAERDAWKRSNKELKSAIDGEFRAIWAKTIEECAQAAEEACDREGIIRGDIIGDAIRALAQTDEDHVITSAEIASSEK